MYLSKETNKGGDFCQLLKFWNMKFIYFGNMHQEHLLIKVMLQKAKRKKVPLSMPGLAVSLYSCRLMHLLITVIN